MDRRNELAMDMLRAATALQVAALEWHADDTQRQLMAERAIEGASAVIMKITQCRGEMWNESARLRRQLRRPRPD